MIIWYQKHPKTSRTRPRDGPHLAAPCQERPFNLFMGGGRFKSKAPMLSWYRNPQFRVSMRQPQAPLSEDGINQNAKKIWSITIHTSWIWIHNYSLSLYDYSYPLVI